MSKQLAAVWLDSLDPALLTNTDNNDHNSPITNRMRALPALAATLALLLAADVVASFAGGRRDLPRSRAAATGATATRSPEHAEYRSGLLARAGPDDERLLDDRARPDILAIKSHDEYVDFIGSQTDDRICVIK